MHSIGRICRGNHRGSRRRLSFSRPLPAFPPSRLPVSTSLHLPFPPRPLGRFFAACSCLFMPVHARSCPFVPDPVHVFALPPPSNALCPAPCPAPALYSLYSLLLFPLLPLFPLSPRSPPCCHPAIFPIFIYLGDSRGTARKRNQPGGGRSGGRGEERGREKKGKECKEYKEKRNEGVKRDGQGGSRPIPVLIRACPYLPVLARTCLSLPVLTRTYPGLSASVRLLPSFSTFLRPLFPSFSSPALPCPLLPSPALLFI